MDQKGKSETEILEGDLEKKASKSIQLNKRNISNEVKKRTLKSSPSSGSKKKQEWEKYFCYISDKEREKMMEVPQLKINRKKERKSKPKNVLLSRSAMTIIGAEKNRIASGEDLTSKDKKSPTNQSKEDLNIESKREEKNKDVSKENENRNKMSKISFDFPKRTLERKLTEKNFNHVNVDTDININLVNALNTLYLKSSYKNLVRSMKANMDNYVQIKEYTSRTMVDSQGLYNGVLSNSIFNAYC
ncbi:unnamed protein product [Brachionus calyciflorus]|uniref:Uncharacterized protein n=1 Tax=Brachionus calyciflorus TaxID=104777 RepID=A0A814AIP2_9BILA|nr:unnamed protein product [Brachionus calyciflorus]